MIYRAAGNPEARVIEQRNHNLDVINDIAPEGMFSIMKDNPTAAAWLPGFPFAHPDPTLPSVLFNTKMAPFDNKDVRWALALADRYPRRRARLLSRRRQSFGSCRAADRFGARTTISCRCRIG